MREARKFGARLLPRRLLDGRAVQPDQPPGGSLVSSKPVSGDGSSATVSASGCPALQLDVLIVAHVPVARDRQRVGPGRLLDRHRRMVADLDVVDQDGGVAGRRRQLDPPRLDGAVVPVDHCRRSRPPRPRAARTTPRRAGRLRPDGRRSCRCRTAPPAARGTAADAGGCASGCGIGVGMRGWGGGGTFDRRQVQPERRSPATRPGGGPGSGGGSVGTGPARERRRAAPAAAGDARPASAGARRAAAAAAAPSAAASS